MRIVKSLIRIVVALFRVFYLFFLSFFEAIGRGLERLANILEKMADGKELTSSEEFSWSWLESGIAGLALLSVLVFFFIGILILLFRAVGWINY